MRRRSTTWTASPLTSNRRIGPELWLQHVSRAQRVFLVPGVPGSRTPFGNRFRETMFRVCPPTSEREARNRVSRTAFPNGVWERDSGKPARRVGRRRRPPLPAGGPPASAHPTSQLSLKHQTALGEGSFRKTRVKVADPEMPILPQGILPLLAGIVLGIAGRQDKPCFLPDLISWVGLHSSARRPGKAT